MIPANYSIFGRKYAPPIHEESLLDFFPGARLALSLRRLRSTYNGPCVRVRRSSDNEERLFGFVDDVVDAVGIEEFCGNSIGYVVAWYSQDDDLKFAKQGSAAMQPYIYANNAIVLDNGKPSIRFPGNQYLVVGSNDPLDPDNVILNTFISCFTVNSSQQGVEFILEHSINANNQQGFYFYGSAGNAWIFVRFLPNYAPNLANGFYWSGPSNTQILATLTFNNTGTYYKNGIVQPNNGGVTNNLPNTPINALFRIMASTGGGYISNGKMQEVIVYNQEEFSNRTGIEFNINNYYNIY